MSTTTGYDIPAALRAVQHRIQQASERAGRSKGPRLVGISKTKPVESLKAAYDAGLRVFGENYVQEIVEKAPLLPEDIEWHFVGHIQSNKAKKLIEAVPNLRMIETVDSKKLAAKINSVVEALDRPAIDILIQVNTSGEESKSGVEPVDCIDLAKFIDEECPRLRFAGNNSYIALGLMTIGMPDYTSRPEDFTALLQCREETREALGVRLEDLEVSMGMSNDFEQATAMGSTNVRVGSAIFGARTYATQ